LQRPSAATEASVDLERLWAGYQGAAWPSEKG
jgi:hypothetical protein